MLGWRDSLTIPGNLIIFWIEVNCIEIINSSWMPLKLEKRRFIILLVVGDISPEVVLNSFIDFKLKYFTQQVFSLLWQCPYNIDTPTVKEDCDILLWENNMCSLGKQDKDNCQHFIDRGIKHHVCPKKAFCFLFHGNFPFYKRQGLIYKILLLKWGLYKKLVFYRKHTY